jgi:hypothetical protein cdivTM7_00219
MDFRSILSSKITTIVLSILLCISILWIFDSYNKLGRANQRQAQVKEYEEQKSKITTPILNSLIPKKTPYWSISYDINIKGEKTTLKIYSKSPHYRFKAFEFLRNIDPEVALKYKIKFMDYKSEAE